MLMKSIYFINNQFCEKDYKLEDWAKIFDIFKTHDAPWILDETKKFIAKHHNFLSLAYLFQESVGILFQVYFLT